MHCFYLWFRLFLTLMVGSQCAGNFHSTGICLERPRQQLSWFWIYCHGGSSWNKIGGSMGWAFWWRRVRGAPLHHASSVRAQYTVPEWPLLPADSGSSADWGRASGTTPADRGWCEWWQRPSRPRDGTCFGQDSQRICQKRDGRWCLGWYSYTTWQGRCCLPQQLNFEIKRSI